MTFSSSCGESGLNERSDPRRDTRRRRRLTTCLTHNPPPTQKNTNSQYPPTFCNDHRCSHSPPRGFAFTIHGLWPQRADGTWPEFCRGADGAPPPNLSLWRLRDLLPSLARAWPSWTLSDRAFWQHEWARHGACAASALGGPDAASRPGGGQHAFFATVLELHRRYSVEDALSAAEIEPSETERYASADVVAAVREAHGVRPHVTCDFKGNLAEVWHCVAKDGKSAVDCGGEEGGGGNAGAGVAAAALARREAERAAGARRRRRVFAPPPPPPPSNAFCRTVALPPPARGARAAVADEAGIAALAGIVVTAAAAAVAAAVRGRRWFATAAAGEGEGETRRPLVASS